MGDTPAIGQTPGPLRTVDGPEVTSERVIERLLRAVREHLGLDVGFVGEIVDGHRVFRYVDSSPGVDAVAVGHSDPLDESYCHLVVAGRLPELLADARQHPLAASLPVTSQLPVGSHVSVPIRFSDGRLYGTFCCFSFQARRSLQTSDLAPFRVVAELAAEHLEAIEQVEAERRRRHQVITEVIEDTRALALVFQPLWDLNRMQIVSLEALARFPGHQHPPNWFFTQASELGLGVELEMRSVRMALAALDDIPAPIRLNVNVSPDTLCSPDFFDAIAGVPANRLVVEVTEHSAIEDYGELQAASERLSASGIWLAIDDVGMGFSGLNRILQSSPEELKLDACVIRDVHIDPVKQALIECFCAFGRQAGLDIVAEGIESKHELDALRALGVKFGQGYHLARPASLEKILSLTKSPPSDASPPWLVAPLDLQHIETGPQQTTTPRRTR